MNVHLIIDHPWPGSFNYAVLYEFTAGLQEVGHSVDVLDLNQDQFNPVISEAELAGYSQGISLDPKINLYQQRLSACDHLVLVFPIWWNVMPARLKGWMDKVLLPGYAFTTDQVPQPMLGHIKGATVLTTTGSPDAYHHETYHDALKWVLCTGTLEFCGIQPVKWLNFGDTGFAERAKHVEWLRFVKGYAKQLT
jgi:putative NADPH-quinone reductase